MKKGEELENRKTGSWFFKECTARCNSSRSKLAFVKMVSRGESKVKDDRAKLKSTVHPLKTWRASVIQCVCTFRVFRQNQNQIQERQAIKTHLQLTLAGDPATFFLPSSLVLPPRRISCSISCNVYTVDPIL